MKNMKKSVCIVIALIMVFALCIPAFATGDITVTNASNGETYSAYKIFDVSKGTGTNMTYTIDSTSKWYSVVSAYAAAHTGTFTLEQIGTSTKYIVKPGTNFTSSEHAADFAAELNENKSGKTADATVTAASGTAAFTGLAEGYYFIDTTLGSLCLLTTTDTSATVQEKNEKPAIAKTFDDDTTDAKALSIGDTVSFKIVVTDKKGTDAAITVYDKMDTGLTLDETSFSVKKGTDDVATTNYVITTTGLPTGVTFKIEFTAAYVASLNENDAIVITYDAVLNKNAEIYIDTNDNSAYLKYQNYTSTDTTPISVVTYFAEIVKTDSANKLLDGAQFEIYDAATGGNKIPLVKDSDGVYHVASAAEIAVTGFTSAVIDAGTAIVNGLGDGKYYLDEIDAPDGYNPLTARQEFEIDGANLDATLSTTGDSWTSGGVQVINNAGTELPTTGGIGTTIFYIVGAILVLCAIVFLITRKRMGDSK